MSAENSHQPILSTLLWILSVVYIYVLLLSPSGQILPGEPIWAIQPQTLQELWNEQEIPKLLVFDQEDVYSN